ncbi:MAG TPA: Rha family transcriptional regulator [Desulfosporosinus sp.]|nr:Rha family transcriptional regulator [Desulfosporosinus sp.]
MELAVINQNGKLLIDSRDVAVMTGKQHKDLLETIRGYEQFLTSGDFRSLDFFIPSTYVDSKGETRPNYYLTRKGCDMVANKMTGEKGVLFTATYITKFVEMENQLKAPIQELSPQLQLLINMELKQKELERTISETKEEIQGIRDVVALNPHSWREDSKNLIVKMARQLGGNEHIRDLRTESYDLLNTRMGVSVETRLTNMRRRMADEGVCVSKRNKLNALDVIADDKKLIEGYVAIVKEMAIKYGDSRKEVGLSNG